MERQVRLPRFNERKALRPKAEAVVPLRFFGKHWLVLGKIGSAGIEAIWECAAEESFASQ